jgi:hypothetical protein
LVLWAASTAVSYTALVWTPRWKAAYHPDVGMYAIDAAGLLSFQALLLGFALLATPRLRLWMVVLAPVVGALLFKFAVVEEAARVLHVLFDGPWLGEDAQDSPFDKQNITANLLFVCAGVLAVLWATPGKRSWDRTAGALVMLGFVATTSAYHLMVFAAPWPGVSQPVREVVAAIERRVVEEGIPPADACPQAPDLACFVFTDAEPFPRSALFDGNPLIPRLRALHEERPPFAPTSEPIPRQLLSSNFDDTYAPLHFRRGFFYREGGRSILFYWDAETAYAVVLAQAVSSVASVFLLLWLAGFVWLVPAHRRWLGERT